MKEIKVFLRYCKISLEQSLFNRAAVVFLLLGKVLRIGLFVLFLSFLFQGTKSLAGYDKSQIILFYLTFNIVDSLSAMLFREVYRFRDYVSLGNLDLILIKPVNPLVRVLLGGVDVFDFVVLVMICVFTAFFVRANFAPSVGSVLLFLALLLNGLLIATAFHIFVVGLGVITTSIDQLVMIYRDVSSMARIPVDLYVEPIRAILTFLIPLGIMMTFPAKALLNILSPNLAIVSFAIAAASFFLSIEFWKHALREYQSASS